MSSLKMRFSTHGEDSLRCGVVLCISKKLFHPGRMRQSESTRCVRAVRDTPVPDYSLPGVNAIRRFAYYLSIAVATCLLVLLANYFNQTLWSCGRLRQYVGMGSLGTRLHRDSNAMGVTAKISPHIACKDPGNCADLQNLTKSD
jgi:hypothetical protein